MYHSDGLKILNLDLRRLGRDRESEGGARFFRGSEMWKAVRPGCSLNVPFWNAAQTWDCFLPVLFERDQQIRHLCLFLFFFCTALLINTFICNILRS